MPRKTQGFEQSNGITKLNNMDNVRKGKKNYLTDGLKTHR